ncbi:MAG TPA: hypothetical protein VII75_06755 [Thermoanaerobaculia bacterium]|nr:hypothetical protein [Thermoanaerobaculia bacterium]
MKALAAAALSLLFPLAAHASLARAATFDDKVENAASIVVGKCVKQHADWDADHRWILTYSTFNVEKSLKGQRQSEITIVTPGGSVGGIHQDTIGMPAFREGNDNVLFIRNTAAGPTVLYFEQGAYDVVRSDKGDRIVQPVASDAVHIDPQRGMAVAPEGPRPLPQFEREVGESMRRALNRMDIVPPHPPKKQASMGEILRRNKLLVMLAAFGLFLSAGQLFKR